MVPTIIIHLKMHFFPSICIITFSSFHVFFFMRKKQGGLSDYYLLSLFYVTLFCVLNSPHVSLVRFFCFCYFSNVFFSALCTCIWMLRSRIHLLGDYKLLQSRVMSPLHHNYIVHLHLSFRTCVPHWKQTSTLDAQVY